MLFAVPASAVIEVQNEMTGKVRKGQGDLSLKHPSLAKDS